MSIATGCRILRSRGGRGSRIELPEPGWSNIHDGVQDGVPFCQGKSEPKQVRGLTTGHVSSGGPVHSPRVFATVRKWAEFVKFSHTIFALPFALASMAVAARDNRGWPGWRTFGLILAAMVCARTCAMAFNRIVDRKFDAANPRTAMRHLPAGKISLSLGITTFAGGSSQKS